MSDTKIDLNSLDKSNWKSYRFDEIAQNISERVDPNNTDLDIYVGLEHLNPEDIHIRRFGTPDDVNGQKLKFYSGDVIFGRRRAYQRKASVAAFDGICSAHALVLRANSSIISPELFPFFIHSNSFMDRAVDISVGSLSPTVNWGSLKEQNFLLPGPASQKEIRKLLSSINNTIECTTEHQLAAQALKKSLLAEIFDKKKCRKLKITSISENLDNQRIPIKKNDRTKGNYPYYGASGIVDYVEDFIFDEKILLISEDGENLNSRKLPIAYEVDEKCWVNNHAHVLKIINESRYLVAEYFNSNDISDFITGGTRPKITKAMLSDMPIFLPQKDKEEKSIKQLRIVDETISNAQNKCNATKELLKNIIQQVF